MPQGRGSRMLHLGRAVGELAAGAAAEGLTRLARGERPALSDTVFTPANARRLAERLSQMRGAVMKLGQLLSMDGEGMLPPAFAALGTDYFTELRPTPLPDPHDPAVQHLGGWFLNLGHPDDEAAT